MMTLFLLVNEPCPHVGRNADERNKAFAGDEFQEHLNKVHVSSMMASNQQCEDRQGSLFLANLDWDLSSKLLFPAPCPRTTSGGGSSGPGQRTCNVIDSTAFCVQFLRERGVAGNIFTRASFRGFLNKRNSNLPLRVLCWLGTGHDGAQQHVRLCSSCFALFFALALFLFPCPSCRPSFCALSLLFLFLRGRTTTPNAAPLCRHAGQVCCRPGLCYPQGAQAGHLQLQGSQRTLQEDSRAVCNGPEPHRPSAPGAETDLHKPCPRRASPWSHVSGEGCCRQHVLQGWKDETIDEIQGALIRRSFHVLMTTLTPPSNLFWEQIIHSLLSDSQYKAAFSRFDTFAQSPVVCGFVSFCGLLHVVVCAFTLLSRQVDCLVVDAAFLLRSSGCSSVKSILNG